MAVTHTFVSAISDGPNTSLVRPVNWNATHTIVADSSFPGYEFDYATKTSTTNITATVESSADTIVTGASVAYNGSTVVWIEFGCSYIQQPGADANVSVWLYDGSSSIGRLALVTSPTATGYSANFRIPTVAKARITPSNASHTYSVRATVSGGTGVIGAGAGGSGADYPAYIRITKA